MTVKQLMELGYTKEQADQIVKLHKEELDGKYETKERNTELREQVKQLKSDIEDRDKQIKDLGLSAEASEKLKEKIAALEESNKAKDKEAQDKMAALMLKNAVTAELAGKVHDVDLVLGMLKTEDIKLSESGAIEGSGLKDQLEKIQKEKSFLFIDPKAAGEKTPAPNPLAGLKLFGQGVPEGQKDPKAGGDEDPGVAFAKEAAKRRSSGAASAKKAADEFFGTMK